MRTCDVYAQAPNDNTWHHRMSTPRGSLDQVEVTYRQVRLGIVEEDLLLQATISKPKLQLLKPEAAQVGCLKGHATLDLPLPCYTAQF